MSSIPNVTEITASQQPTISSATEISEPPDAVATLVRVDEDPRVDPCETSFDPSSCNAVGGIPFLPSATGWEETDPATDRLVTLTPTKTTVTTIQPTILDLETNIVIWGADDSTQESGGNNGQPSLITGPNTVSSADIPGQTEDNIVGGDDTSATGLTPQQTGQNSLLLAIVSQIGGAPSVVQPTQPASLATDSLGQPVVPTNNEGGGNSATAQPATTPSSGMPSSTNIASPPQTTPAVGVGSFVYGSSTLTLTPGLNTNIGSNFFPTFVELTTDAKGNTLVTVFSDGTAVTATVRVTSTTMTIPISGYEASMADSTGPAEQTGSLATISSEGAGAETRSTELEWLAGAILGILGFGVIL